MVTMTTKRNNEGRYIWSQTKWFLCNFAGPDDAIQNGTPYLAACNVQQFGFFVFSQTEYVVECEMFELSLPHESVFIILFIVSKLFHAFARATYFFVYGFAIFLHIGIHNWQKTAAPAQIALQIPTLHIYIYIYIYISIKPVF